MFAHHVQYHLVQFSHFAFNNTAHVTTVYAMRHKVSNLVDIAL